MAAFVRRHGLLVYYLLALAICSGVMVVTIALALRDPSTLAVLGDLSGWLTDHDRYANVPNIARFAIVTDRPVAFLIFVFALAPTIAAYVVSAAWGSAGIRRLVARYRPWLGTARAGAALRVYAWLFGVYLLGVALSIAVPWYAGDPVDVHNAFATLGGTPLLIAWTLLIGPFVDEGALLEETGWRGFALPWLQERLRTPLHAAVALGVMWAAWHLPREVLSFLGPVNAVQWMLGQSVFFVDCIALSIVITYCVNLCGGSIIPAILIHGGTNVWAKAVGLGIYHQLGPTLIDPRTVVEIVAAIAVIAVAGARLGLHERVAPEERYATAPG